MIIRKSIFIRLNSLNNKDLELFNESINSFSPHKCSCPKCGARGQHKKIGSYPRVMISCINGNRCVTHIKIPRVQCMSCRHTHAIIPDILIPFGSYTITFILTVLKAYIRKKYTVTALCSRYHISISTLYTWIHVFVSRYNSWAPVLDRIQKITYASISHVMHKHALPSFFFERFHFHFFQAKTTPSHYARSTPKICPGTVT